MANTTKQRVSEHDEQNPRHHTTKLKGMLHDVITHAREDVQKVNDPKAQALFETTAEVLQGLVKAYDHFENKSEPAWQGSSGSAKATPQRNRSQTRASTGASSSPRKSDTDTPQISKEEVRQNLESGQPMVILDVRLSEDWQNSDVKLPGAIRISPDEAEDRSNEVPDGAITVVYSAGSDDEQSVRVVSELLKDNRHDVFVLGGGFDEWQAADYPLENKTAQEKSLEA